MTHYQIHTANRLKLIVLTLLLASCSILFAQQIVPHRDIQAVDSLNRGKPTTAPVTVNKAGWFQATREDGKSYWEKIAPYITDTLQLGGRLDSAYINAGDSLVIITTTGDTIYFAGGAGSNIFTANQNGTGNRTHDGNNFNQTFNDMGSFALDIPNALKNFNVHVGDIGALNTESVLHASQNQVLLQSNSIIGSSEVDLQTGNVDIRSSGIGYIALSQAAYIALNSVDSMYTFSPPPKYKNDGLEYGLAVDVDDHYIYSTDLPLIMRDTISTIATHHDILGLSDDRSFYDYGTTDMPVTSDDSIETTNVKYVLFNGLDGGLPTKIEILKEGTIQFDKTGIYNAPTWLYSHKPLQTDVGSPRFGLVAFAGDNTGGARKNNTYAWGINPGGIDVGTALYLSLEGHYQPTAVDSAHEFHLVMKDIFGNSRRIWSWFLPKDDPDLWSQASYVQHFFLRDPNQLGSDGTYFGVNRETDDQSRILFLASGGSTGGGSDGVEFLVNRNDNYLAMQPYGSMPSTAEMYVINFNAFNMKRARISTDWGTLHGSDGNPAYLFGGESFYGGVVRVGYPELADSLDTYLSGGSDHDWYEVGGTSPPDAISDNIFKSTGTVHIGGSSAGAQTLHVTGNARITSSSGVATSLMGRDNDGDINAVTPGPGLSLVDNTLLVTGGGSESIFGNDSMICFIIMGDTSCVYRDSSFQTDTSYCFIIMGDTTCIEHNTQGGNLIYYSDGAFTSPRTATVNGSNTFRFVRNDPLGVSELFKIEPQGNTNSMVMGLNSASVNKPILAFKNIAGAGNIYMKFENIASHYSMGIDRATGLFNIAEGAAIHDGATHYMSFSNAGDSIIFKRDVQINAGLLDKDGDYGTSGYVLSTNGSEVDWISPAATITASNGLTKVGDDIQLGGNITNGGNTDITVGSGEALRVVTSTSGVNPFTCFSSTGSAMTGAATSSGIGVTAQSATGTALSASTGGSALAGLFLTASIATNTVIPISKFMRYSSGTPANGFGTSFQFFNETDDNNVNQYLSNELKWLWTDVTTASRTSQMILTGVSAATTNDILYLEGDKRVRFNGRAEEQQGADVASAAGAIALGYDGNTFEITGTSAITLLSNLGWQNGSTVTLIFNSTASLVDGTANSGTDIGFELGGNANFNATADDLITLKLCEMGGTQRWREQYRSAN